MHSSIPSEKMNPQASAYGNKRGGWCDDGKMRSYTRQPDNSKPRNKRDYTQQRKLKEKFLVFSS